MDISRIIIGFFVSTVGGAFILWLLIDKIAWPYLGKKHNISIKYSGVLSLPLGIIERASYTAALIIGVPGWVAVWLAMKVAIRWKRFEAARKGTYNLFLIGNALSIMFGLIGAWIALGRLPSFTK